MAETKTRLSTRQLSCMLNEDEVRLRGIDLANYTKTHMDLQDEKKASAKAFKEKIDATNVEISRLKDSVRNGSEVRETQVEYRMDTYTGKVVVVRLDTGEVIERRDMTPAEMQGRFDFEEPSAPF